METNWTIILAGYEIIRMGSKKARQNLIRILQSAYSGEVAAAFAYRGHWRSLKESPERTHIREIEAGEWDHRERVDKWLEKLDAKPRALRENVFWIIGRTLGGDLLSRGLVHADVFCRTA